MTATRQLEIPASFSVEWCNTCQQKFVRCPRCGNNSCNGTYGEDGECPVCPLAYDLMYASWDWERNQLIVRDDLKKELESLRSESSQWEDTARRLAHEAGHENSDYFRPDDRD